MRVSVVIPAYNVASYIEQALRSVLPQTLSEFEILVVDDGSTDGTASIVADIADPRIRLIRQQNTGVVGALNHGLDQAVGPLIARLDGDDEMAPGRLAAQVAFLESNPEVLACGTDYELFGDMTGRVRTPHSPAHCRARLMFGNPIAHPAAMIRRSALDEHGLRYRTEFAGAEDFKLFSELARFGELANLPAVGLRYRRHGGQISTAGRDRQRELHLAICLDNLREAGITTVSAERLAGWLWPVEDGIVGPAGYLTSAAGLLATGYRAAGSAGLATASWLIRENLAGLRHRPRRPAVARQSTRRVWPLGWWVGGRW